jgi:predicted GH43/DUF377 family glycosyl hydrolase
VLSAPDGGHRLVVRSSTRLCPDSSRVIALPFFPGEEMPSGDSRVVSVVERILAMDDAEVDATLVGLDRRFAHRHHQLEAKWSDNFRLASLRLGNTDHIPAHRALVIGAYFTREISVEAAALFNPSMVTHMDQSGLREGEQRFVMSLRAVSEGHLSAIEFRTGTVDAIGHINIDDPGSFLEVGAHSAGPYRRDLFHAKLAEQGCDNQAAALVLDQLQPQFEGAALEAAIGILHRDLLGRVAVRAAIDRIRWVAANNYTVEFPLGSAIGERVLWPHGPSEVQGLEDARFVRFVDDDGAVSYFATYTAFDQVHVTTQLLSTTDFRSFVVSQVAGPFAVNKGMALFPRKLGGRYVALSRWDRENLAVTLSDNGYEWAEATTLRWSPGPWELVQVGNCGSPIETPEGWLVLTHGVGPMRSYSIGAILLDLDDPRRVIANLAEPILVAEEDEREGYVPNVVYSCGALRHGGKLVLPYGLSDSSVGFALIDLPELLSSLTNR